MDRPCCGARMASGAVRPKCGGRVPGAVQASAVSSRCRPVMPLGENSFPAAPKNTDSGTQTGPEGPVGPYPCGPASVALCHAPDLRRDAHQQLGLFLVARLALEPVAVERVGIGKASCRERRC